MVRAHCNERRVGIYCAELDDDHTCDQPAGHNDTHVCICWDEWKPVKAAAAIRPDQAPEVAA